MEGVMIPAVCFNINLPIRRIGEGLLFASRFADTFEEVDQIVLSLSFYRIGGTLPEHRNPASSPLYRCPLGPIPVARMKSH